MIKYICIITLFFISTSVYSQDWLTQLEDAKATAQKQNKNIVLVFSGSDWCAPCIKLEKELWSTTTFKNYAKENLVLLKADFPRRKKNALPKEQQKHNNTLAEQYNTQGFFPLAVILDQDGNLLGKTGYKKIKPQDYITLFESFN